MSNCYTSVSAEKLFACTDNEFAALKAALATGKDDVMRESHGFELERQGGMAFIFAELAGTEEYLPKVFLAVVGQLLRKAGTKFLSFGCACYADKMRVDSHGGYNFRITDEGKLIHPELVWPA